LDILDSIVQKMEGGQRIEIADLKSLVGVLAMVSEQTGVRTLIERMDEALAFRKGAEFVLNSRELTKSLRTSIDDHDGDGVVHVGGEKTELSANLSRLEKKYAIHTSGQPSYSFVR
jgi:hypothetical protein